MTGSIFGYRATGTCGKEDDICDCDVTQKYNSLDSLWNAKFGSKDILQQIKNNKYLSEQVREILQYPFRTAQEIKNELKSVLSENQYKKLKLNDNSPAAKMTKKDELDYAAIRKYVVNKLPATLKISDNKTLSALKYEPVLLEALEDAERESQEQNNDAFDELISAIRRTRNKSLGSILTKYLKKNKLNEPARDNNESSAITNTIADYVIDELVKKIGKKKPTTNKRFPAKKPAKKIIQETKSKKSDIDDADNSDIALQKDRFVLKNFDKSELQKSGKISKNWTKNGYDVNYERDEKGDISMWWKKGHDKMWLQKSGTYCNQHWIFGNVDITLNKTLDKKVSTQTWNFGNNSYKYSRDSNRNTVARWSTGEPDEKTLKTYQKFINAWCRDNDFLVDRKYCIIYNE